MSNLIYRKNTVLLLLFSILCGSFVQAEILKDGRWHSYWQTAKRNYTVATGEKKPGVWFTAGISNPLKGLDRSYESIENFTGLDGPIQQLRVGDATEVKKFENYTKAFAKDTKNCLSKIKSYHVALVKERKKAKQAKKNLANKEKALKREKSQAASQKNRSKVRQKNLAIKKTAADLQMATHKIIAIKNLMLDLNKIEKALNTKTHNYARQLRLYKQKASYTKKTLAILKSTDNSLEDTNRNCSKAKNIDDKIKVFNRDSKEVVRFTNALLKAFAKVTDIDSKQFKFAEIKVDKEASTEDKEKAFDTALKRLSLEVGQFISSIDEYLNPE